MGLRDVFRRNDPELMAITASGRHVELSEEKEKERKKKRAEKWQEAAWDFYDEIPEIWFAVNYAANVIRRVRIYPALQEEPDVNPVKLTVEEHGDFARRAYMELDRLRSDKGTHGDLLHDLSIQFDVPGDAYLVLTTEEGKETSGIYSSSELDINSEGKWMLKDGPQDREGTPLDPDAFVSRLWSAHPRWKKKADSPMKGVLELCDELQILSRGIRARARSGIPAGLFLVPSEVTLRAADGSSSPQSGNANEVDPVLAAMMEALVGPVGDEGSPLSVAPGMMKIKSDYIEKFRHITFDRPFEEQASHERMELIGRISTGIDLPAEVVQGKADLNHWSMWQVDEDTFKAHIEPRCIKMTSSLAQGFLRVAMGDLDDARVQYLTIWFDAIDAVTHPSRSRDTDQAWDRNAISDVAYRRYKGYSEDDAPSEEEIEKRVERRKAQQPAQPRGADGSNPAEDDERGAPGASLVAAATPSVDGLGEKLTAIDRELRQRLQVAAQGVVFRALERAGAKLRRKVGRNDFLKAKIDGVPNHLVASALSEKVVRQWFETDDELIEDAMGPLRPMYQRWTDRAQSQVRGLISDFGKIDEVVVLAEQAAARDAGWVVLQDGLSGVLKENLFNPDAVSGLPGEADSTLSVPPGVIRESVAVAGGATGSKSGGGAIINPTTGEPQGGVATGDIALESFARVGVTVGGWQWVYGNSDHPFPGHEQLDGVVFSTWEDDELAVSEEDSWIGESHYFPGDHFWCGCDFIPLMTSNEE